MPTQAFNREHGDYKEICNLTHIMVLAVDINGFTCNDLQLILMETN